MRTREFAFEINWPLRLYDFCNYEVALYSLTNKPKYNIHIWLLTYWVHYPWGLGGSESSGVPGGTGSSGGTEVKYVWQV